MIYIDQFESIANSLPNNRSKSLTPFITLEFLRRILFSPVAIEARVRVKLLKMSSRICYPSAFSRAALLKYAWAKTFLVLVKENWPIEIRLSRAWYRSSWIHDKLKIYQFEPNLFIKWVKNSKLNLCIL